jgi:hypothetical protein
MKMFKSLVCVAALAGALSWIPGCGSAADENKPMSEITSESQSMSAEDLRSMAMSYKEVIEKKVGELGGIKEQLKAIPLTKQLGEDAKVLQEEIKTVAKSIKALKERFAVYYDKLKEKGSDLSGLKI